MPNYDYKCSYCKQTFEKYALMSDAAKKVSCKYCGQTSKRNYARTKTFLRYRADEK